MDVRNWLYLRRTGCHPHCFVLGRDVSRSVYLKSGLSDLLRRLYDRKLANPRPIPRPSSALLCRLQTLVGITGARMAKYRPTWREVTWIWFQLVWRPHLLGVLCFEVSDSTRSSIHASLITLQALLFGFSIGINVSLFVSAYTS